MPVANLCVPVSTEHWSENKTVKILRRNWYRLYGSLRFGQPSSVRRTYDHTVTFTDRGINRVHKTVGLRQNVFLQLGLHPVYSAMCVRRVINDTKMTNIYTNNNKQGV
jgi:hypothetical protein